MQVQLIKIYTLKDFRNAISKQGVYFCLQLYISQFCIFTGVFRSSSDRNTISAPFLCIILTRYHPYSGCPRFARGAQRYPCRGVQLAVKCCRLIYLIEKHHLDAATLVAIMPRSTKNMRSRPYGCFVPEVPVLKSLDGFNGIHRLLLDYNNDTSRLAASAIVGDQGNYESRPPDRMQTCACCTTETTSGQQLSPPTEHRVLMGPLTVHIIWK